jgi:putative DNA primase/helicase
MTRFWDPDSQLCAEAERLRLIAETDGTRDGHARPNGYDSRAWPDLDLNLAKDDRAPPPPFDESILSSPLLEWARRTADDCSTPIDYVAGGLIGTASAMLGNARRVSPWAPWVEHPFIWIALVGNPSSGKTPALMPFKNALMTVESDAQPGHAEAMRRWEAEREKAAARAEAWKKEIKVAAAKGGAAPEKPRDADTPRQPTPSRLVIVDATTEEAANLLARNHRGLVLVRSELSGWVGQLDRYGGNGADRAFYLESWDGGPHTIDRVKHNGEPVQVRYCSLAIIGGLQPDKLRDVFSGPDDGLAERFSYIWPDPVPPHRPNSRGANERAGLLLRIFRRLRSLDWDRDGTGLTIPKIIRVDDGALQILDTIRNQIAEAAEREPGILACWRGKNPGRLLRLALTLEYLEWAANPDGTIEPEIVSPASMKRAASYIDYLDAMMVRALGELAVSEAQRVAALIARMILEERPAEINERSLYRRAGFSELRDKEFRDDVLAELERAGWVRRKRSVTGRKPSPSLEINPQL